MIADSTAESRLSFAEEKGREGGGDKKFGDEQITDRSIFMMNGKNEE